MDMEIQRGEVASGSVVCRESGRPCAHLGRAQNGCLSPWAGDRELDRASPTWDFGGGEALALAEPRVGDVVCQAVPGGARLLRGRGARLLCTCVKVHGDLRKSMKDNSLKHLLFTRPSTPSRRAAWVAHTKTHQVLDASMPSAQC
jgi:hypothetical protein